MNCATFLGSLLYVRNQKETIVEEIWEALDDDGILIIHENIKNTGYERDYDLMFTAQELDALLEKFGEIVFFRNALVV